MDLDASETALLQDLFALLERCGLADPRAEAAFRLAARAHRGQTRSDGPPYLVHPLNAARIVLEEWGHPDVDLACAALLHDALEDGPIAPAEVEAAAGPRVLRLVELLTKAPVPPEQKAERDRAYYAALQQDPGARLVKAADRLDNLRSLRTARWPVAKKRAYAEEALRDVLPAVREGWPREAAILEALARAALDECGP